MELTYEKGGNTLIVKVSGRIDTNTAMDFGTQINDSIDDINDLNIDFANVDYISSLGLRALLELKKTMSVKNGSMRLFNVSDALKEIFNMTGFNKILTIE